MSFTSNSWKKSGGRDRNKNLQNINSNNMNPTNFNTRKIGESNTLIPAFNNFKYDTNSGIFNATTGERNFQNMPIYYPFNNYQNTSTISNESLNPELVNPSDLNLILQDTSLNEIVGNLPKNTTSPFNQSATLFDTNSKIAITPVNYNTESAFGVNNPVESISSALLINTFLYVSSETKNFCLCAIDDISQNNLRSNEQLSFDTSPATGLSGECLYIWYPDYDGSGRVLFISKNNNPNDSTPFSAITYTFTPIFDEWHEFTTCLAGNSIYTSLNGNIMNSNSTAYTNGTFIPNNPISINLAPYYFDPTDASNPIQNSGTYGPQTGSVKLLEYKIANFAATANNIQSIQQFITKNSFGTGFNLPNKNGYLDYVLNKDITFFTNQILSDGGLNNNGQFNNYGMFQNFSTSIFYDDTYFKGNVYFQAPTTSLFDSSLVKQLTIFSPVGSDVTHSFLIENGGAADSNATFNPTMLVYNRNTNNTTFDTNGLMFSISGENVSIGDIFGSNTLDISGNVAIHNGNLTMEGGEITINNLFTTGGVYIEDLSNPTTLSDSSNSDSSAFSVLGGGGVQKNFFVGGLLNVGNADSNSISPYIVDISGNTNITGSLELTGNKINITNSTPNSSIAMGSQAGYTNQNEYSIAIGSQAGQTDQSANSIAIGQLAGSQSLGQNSIAIGANTVNKYTTSVALGAGATTTANNQIVLGTASETVTIPGILDATLQDINVLGNITLGGEIEYSDETRQISSYTGAALLAGDYSAANITIDSDGKITSISSGSSGPSQTVFDSQTVNFNNFRQTNKIKSITYDNNTTIRDSLIKTNMNGRSSKGETTVTFGTEIEPRWVAVGEETNAIAYSSDGINWTPVNNSTSIFSYGRGVAWNGTLWVAVGGSGYNSTNTIAYSSDGITWTGLGKTIFSQYGYGVAWNGTLWVAVGVGGGVDASGQVLGQETIAYSYDGITWTPSSNGNSIFTGYGYGVAWNGTLWVAVGEGTNHSIAYSYDGITWTPSSNGNSIFTYGYGVAWNGTLWVAVGEGTNTIAYSYDGITWTGLGNSIFTYGYGVAWNGTLWVAVGDGTTNTIATSPDGITWTGRSSNGIFSLRGREVAWNGTLWVAVGEGQNRITYSYDGITWTGLGNSIFSTRGYGVAFNNARPHSITYPRNLTIAVGTGTNTIAYSSDGINWTPSSNGNSIFTYGRGVAWNGTLWVAVGSGTTNTIATSPDGITWTGLGKTIFSLRGRGVAWNGTLWVAVGEGTNTIATSPDGITWTGRFDSNGNSIFSLRGRGVAWNGTLWVAVGEGTTNTIAYSYDGITWTGLGSSIFTGYGYGVAWNGTLWVAVGEGTNTIATSPDGITWTGRFDSNGNSIFTYGYGVAWNGTLWVAVGEGTNTIAYSYDGITWTPSSNGNSIFSTYGYGVAWNGTLWVAVGDGTTNTIATSPDGITWTGRGRSIFDTIGYGVAWNKNLPKIKIQQPIVAVGSGTNTIAYSVDGKRWTGRGNSIFSTQGRGVAWNGTLWVAVGYGTNTIATSYDGITWTASSNGTSIFSTQGNGVAWNGTLWVAVGEGTNSIATSPDGITWTGRFDSNGTSIFSSGGKGVAWNGTLWVAVGEGTHTIATSPDGITWTASSNGTSIFSTQGNGVAWNGTLWVAVGEGTYTIGTSYDGITWTPVNNSTSIFSGGKGVAWNGTLWVAVGYGTYTIATSPDGITWTPVNNSTSIFSGNAFGVAWNGTLWVAVGTGTNRVATSPDGITWTGLGNSIFTTAGVGVAGNPKIGATIVDSDIIINSNGINASNSMEFVTENYYQQGVNNISITVKTANK